MSPIWEIYLVVCRAHWVLCTWTIIWLRLGTFSLVLLVIKLGVAGSFFVTFPLSSVTLRVTISGRVTFFSVFRPTAALELDEAADIGTKTLTLPSESRVVSVPTCDRGFIRWVSWSLASRFRSRLTARLSSKGLAENDDLLRVPRGDGVKLLPLDGELSKLALLLPLKALELQKM